MSGMSCFIEAEKNTKTRCVWNGLRRMWSDLRCVQPWNGPNIKKTILAQPRWFPVVLFCIQRCDRYLQRISLIIKNHAKRYIRWSGIRFRKRSGFGPKSLSEIYRRKTERYWHVFRDRKIRRVPGKSGALRIKQEMTKSLKEKSPRLRKS